MQHVAFRRRPALERRRITAHRTKITVMQPINHLRLLLHARPGPVLASRELGVLQRRARIVVLDPAGADKEDIAGLDGAALRGRSDVEALPLAHLDEVVVRDGVARRGVVFDVVGFGVRFVVEQDAAAREPVLAPQVDAALVRLLVAGGEIGVVRVVVECRRRLVGDVAEAVPLCAGLGVHVVDVVVGFSLVQRLDLMVEHLASERGLGGHVRWQVEGCALAGLDLAGGLFDSRWSQEVQASAIVVPRQLFKVRRASVN